MADAGTVTALMGVAAGVSATYQVTKSRDPFPVLMASGIAYAGVCLLGQLVDWQLAAAVAAVICLGVVIFRSGPLVAGVQKLVNSPAASSKTIS